MKTFGAKCWGKSSCLTAACIVSMSMNLHAEDSMDRGTFSLDARFRGELAEIETLKDADNVSLRLRPGYLTPQWNGFQAMVEGEFTIVADRNTYNAAGVHGDPAKAIIADPENTQLDQLWVSYTYEESTAKAGRQVIALDNHRWIGHVGWRQNRQTFDALTVKNTSIGGLELMYGYIDNVVRIFGDEAPSSGANAEEFGSDSHLVHAAYQVDELGTVTAFGYFLDLDDAPGKIAGSDTVGISYHGACTAFDDIPMGVYLEYARQRDAGNNVQSYEANYIHLTANTEIEGLSLAAGYELLGSDTAGVDETGMMTYASVKTPLATLHKFNGFADVFLVTPDKGLEDIYAKAAYTISLGDIVGPLTGEVWYHDFSTDRGSDDLGSEFDAVLIKPIKIEGMPGSMNAIVKYANYQAPTGGADVERLSGEVNYILTF